MKTILTTLLAIVFSWLFLATDMPLLVVLMSLVPLYYLADYHSTVHKKKIDKGGKINHIGAWSLRLIILAAYSFLITIPKFDWQMFAGLTIFMMSIGGIVFMVMLNDKRDRELLYLGNTAYWDKKFNKWFGRFAGLAYCIVLFVFAVLGVLIYDKWL